MSFNSIKNITVISIAISFLFLLHGCSFLEYRESKLDVENINDTLNVADTENDTFNEHLIKNGYLKEDLPIQQWGLDELILAQLFFNRELRTAKSEWDIIQAEEGIAALSPSTSLGVNIGRGDSSQEISQNIYGAGFSFTFESADKKLIRHEIAFNKTQSALLSFQIKATESKSQLLETLINYIENHDLIITQKKEVQVRQSIFLMVKKRFDLGIASQIDIDRLALAMSSSYQVLTALQAAQEELKQKLATHTGMTLEKFNLLPINADKIKNSLKRSAETFTQKTKINEIKRAATLNSLSLRKLLADYAITESELKYAIAKQYPDYTFTPAYTYDLGNYIWSLGIDSAITSSEKNIMLINKAEKIRALGANKIYAYQLELLNQAEQLLPAFENKKNALDHTETLLEAKNRLTKQLQEQFEKGYMDRLDLELELAKLYEVDKKYHKALYNLIYTGLDAERIMQKPIITYKAYFINEE